MLFSPPEAMMAFPEAYQHAHWSDLAYQSSARRQVCMTGAPTLVIYTSKQSRNAEETHAWLCSQYWTLQQWEEGNCTQSKAWETFDRLSWRVMTFTLCHPDWDTEPSKTSHWCQRSKGKELEITGTSDSEMIATLYQVTLNKQLFFCVHL